MSKLYGVIEGVYYNGFERTEELSKRMYERNVTLCFWSIWL